MGLYIGLCKLLIQLAQKKKLCYKIKKTLCPQSERERERERLLMRNTKELELFRKQWNEKKNKVPILAFPPTGYVNILSLFSFLIYSVVDKVDILFCFLLALLWAELLIDFFSFKFSFKGLVFHCRMNEFLGFFSRYMLF